MEAITCGQWWAEGKSWKTEMLKTEMKSPMKKPSSAEFHSAVSQIFNLRTVRNAPRRPHFQRAAECNSAIQQIKNLRYEEGAPHQSVN
jgi:hypothetical protein